MGSFSTIRKYKKQKISTISVDEKIDLYSFTFSFIFHTAIILFMSLVFFEYKENKPQKIELAFSNTESFEDIEPFEPESIKVEIESVPNSETPNINDIVETVPEIEMSEPISIDNTTSNYSQTALSIDQTLESFDTIQKEELPNNDQTQQNQNILEDLIGSVAQGFGSSHSTPNVPNFNYGNNIGQRLKQAGAQTGDVQISIAWNTVDDIDLHVSFSPGNGLVDNINWTNRIGRLTRGMLDIDMNANSHMLNPNPVENIFWPPNSSPNGQFSVYIHFFRSWTGSRRVPVIIVVKSFGKTNTYNMVAILGSNPQYITTFSTLGNKKKF